MNKPTGYEQVAAGEYTPIELGGHRAIIIGVEETKSKTNKDMIKVAIDFDNTDCQPEYFKNQFQNDDRPDKKWPYQAVQYILTEDINGTCSSSFKRFVTSVEKSNNAECPWGENFSRWFKGKRVGVVYGEVEEEYNGETKMRHRIRYFCDYEKAESAAIPAAKTIVGTQLKQAVNKINEGFIQMPDTDADFIPF